MATKQQLGQVANAIGERGEGMAELALTSFETFPKPLFRVARLGAKWQTTDLYVELEKVRARIPAALFQVKTPVRGLRTNQTQITVHLSKSDVVRLSKIPLPVYVLGVCHKTERVFVRAVPKSRKKGITAVPITHELDEPNLQRLHDEIAAYWSTFTPATINTHFP
jgi:hypothetical protein